MSQMRLVGILNITPDSFSDGGMFLDTNAALEQAKKLFADGADILDVGGESTNPKAQSISPLEEWERIKTIITKLIELYPGKISLDTRHPETANKFLVAGGTILNDVSGFQNPDMIKLAAEFQPLCVVNHFPAKSPAEVHALEIDSIDQVKQELLAKRDEMICAGIKSANIILDPGIGFGKSTRLNNELVEFCRLVAGIPVMIGYSRKRFLGENRFEVGPNIIAGKRAIDSGAAYIRVHDIKPYRELAQQVFLGLGANIEPRQQYVDTALSMLKKEFGELTVSSIYETKAWGMTDQPDFLNLCVGLKTSVSPHELLKRVKQMEKDIGRKHRKHWGPREIDIDIILYGQEIVETDELKIPHPGMHERSSVLDPLVEIAPGAIHPLLKKSVKQLQESL